MKKEEKKYLLWGIIGGILTMIGDCLLLGADSTGAGRGALDKFALIATRVSYTRIGLAGFFGFIGIPLSALGFYALYCNLNEKRTMVARLYRFSIYGFGALGGAIHMICCYLLTGIKKDLESGADDLFKIVFRRTGRLCHSVHHRIFGILSFVRRNDDPIIRWEKNISPAMDVAFESACLKNINQSDWRSWNLSFSQWFGLFQHEPGRDFDLYRLVWLFPKKRENHMIVWRKHGGVISGLA